MTKQGQPFSALEILVDRLFDYAGMFPPAALSFEEALATSAKLKSELRRPYLLASDIVLSFENLKKLEHEILQAAGFVPAQLLTVCALGTAFKIRQDLISEQRLDELKEIQAFNAQKSSELVPIQVTSYEFKFEGSIQSDVQAVQVALRNIKSFLHEDHFRLCVEPDLSVEDWEQVLDKFCHILSDLNLHSIGPEVVLKVRGGGATAVNNHKLLKVVEQVCKYNLNLKATAGLHHPIIEKDRYQNSLGFLNLSVALYLKRALGSEFPAIEVLNCLFASSLEHFNFGQNLAWKEYQIPLEQLRSLKEQFPFSIGSCSLHEPDQDLARLFDDA